VIVRETRYIMFGPGVSTRPKATRPIPTAAPNVIAYEILTRATDTAVHA